MGTTEVVTAVGTEVAAREVCSEMSTTIVGTEVSTTEVVPKEFDKEMGIREVRTEVGTTGLSAVWERLL